MQSKWHDLSDLTDEELMRAFQEAMGETDPKMDLSDADEAIYGAWEILSGDREPGGTTMDTTATMPSPKEDPASEMSDDEVYAAAKATTNWEGD